MQTVFVFLGYRTQGWVRKAQAVSAVFSKKGYRTCLVDIVDFSFPRQSNIATLKNIEGFDETLSLSRSKQSPFAKTGMDKIRGRESISTALSLTKNESSQFLFYYYAFMLVKRAKGLQSACSKILQPESGDLVVIPNGRHPWETEIEKWSSTLFIETWFYESSLINDRVFLAKYKPTDLKAHESAFKSFSESEEHAGLTEIWLTERGAFHRRSTDVERFKQVLFTSSSDEFWALPQEWHSSEWNSQYEAFDTLLSKTDPGGKQSAIRIHPNLLNKSIKQLLREDKAVSDLLRNHPFLTVIPPHSKTSSYNLVDKANLVVTTLSTIGLEAAAMGKTVVLTTVSHYSNALDLPVISSRLEAQSGRLTKIQSDSKMKKKAGAYLAFLRNSSIPLAPNGLDRGHSIIKRLAFYSVRPIDLLVILHMQTMGLANRVVSKMVRWGK